MRFLCTIILVLGVWYTPQAQLPELTDEQAKQIEELLDDMTTEEKIGQLTLFTSDWDVTGPTLRGNYKEDILAGKVGAIFNAHTADYNRELQRMSVEETRLGIPLLFGYDVIHGYKTIFPISLGESASWDLEAIEESAQVAAAEAAAAGLHWTFAPMVDISRDPRWGRISEGAGEDPYLGSRIAEARVRGFQGDDLAATNTLIACAKHFAAYGAAQAGRDYHTVDMSERVLRHDFLPPFKAALDAGVQSFMTAFNELFGVPASGSHYLLTEILRDEWGFNGFVVTDYTSINEMIPHGVVADEKEAGELALTAGVDMDMQGAVFYNHLRQSLKEGKVTEAQIDQAVMRILRVKMLLGLFDDPYRYSDVQRQEETILAEAHLEKAREVARKSMVLLKNNGVLPLSKSGQKIALIGPLADSQADLLGSWHAAGSAEDAITLKTALEDMLAPSSTLLHARGCEVEGEDRSGFPEALAAARQADVAVLAVGENWWMSGEAASRSELDLPGVQLELIKAIKETGTPVVVVLMNGRPLAIPEVDETADAILETWFAGTMGGPAIADIILGDANPSGRLPVTFPRNVGQVPLYYSMKNTGRPMEPNNKYTTKYLDVPNTPLYPFGYGLGYTTFEYGEPSASAETFSEKNPVEFSVKVRNTGDRAGRETVQFYVRDLVGSVTRPVLQLKGFRQIDLEPGETKTVTFTLTTDDVAFYRRDMSYGWEPGDFELFVGPNAQDLQSVRVELTSNKKSNP
jgi:beta-glucosidase